jgi:DNA invertase Pin-like site-specific DNA recombinase
MPKTIAYLRTSTDKQELNNQKLAILEYAQTKNLKIDEFIEIKISSRKTPKQRRIEDILEKLSNSDTLVVTELSRLGRSTAEVIELFNELVKRSIRVIAIKQSLDITKQDINSKATITLFSLFSELERDLISVRTKEALAAKKLQGQVLGKPNGTIQKSKFDKDAGKIKELLKLGLSVRKISKFFGYNNHISLNTYINKRNLRNELE